MDIETERKEAVLREQIVEAGKMLVRTGLVARTWGNISARLSESEMIITPSGRDYMTAKPSDQVKMNINDLSWEPGQLKPSSEKGIHGAVYRLRPQAGFVIHTHQFFAGAVCADLKDVIAKTEDGTPVLIPCAPYGRPGTEALWDGVEKCILSNPKAASFLMARHGVLIIGTTMEDAFEKAARLEEACRLLFIRRVPEAAGLKGSFAELYRRLYPGKEMAFYLDDYAQIFPPDYDIDDSGALALVTERNAAAALYAFGAPPMDEDDAAAQHSDYVNGYSKLKDR